jgi:hypothetical protein
VELVMQSEDPMFKIDTNSYASITFPVAIYRREAGLRLFPKWEHIESCKTQEEAFDKVQALLTAVRSLPRYFSL